MSASSKPDIKSCDTNKPGEKTAMSKHCCFGLLIGAAALGSLLAGTALAQKPLPPLPQPETPAPVPAILQNYKPVTAQQLKQPTGGDWLMYRRTYDGWGYS